MEHYNRIVFNMEILYLKAKIEKNMKEQQNIGDILIYLAKNKNETLDIDSIPAGKKRKSMIREIVSSNKDNHLISDFLTMLCKFYDMYVKYKTILKTSKHFRICYNIRFMQKYNEIFNNDDMFKEMILKSLYEKLRKDSVKKVIDQNENVEELVEKMKEWIDPNFDWDTDKDDYYVQYPIHKIMTGIIVNNEDGRQLETWMKIAPFYISKNDNMYRQNIINIGVNLALEEMCA